MDTEEMASIDGWKWTAFARNRTYGISLLPGSRRSAFMGHTRLKARSKVDMVSIEALSVNVSPRVRKTCAQFP